MGNFVEQERQGKRAVACLFLLTTLVLGASAWGHPGNGIIVLNDGGVLTGDAVANGTWVFRPGQAPQKRTSDFHCHWLTRGLDGRIYAENQKESGGRWVAEHFLLDQGGANPTRLGSGPLHRANFTADRQGRLVFFEGGRLVQKEPSGALTPFRGRGQVAKGDPPLASVSAFAWGPNDALYLASGDRVRKAGPDGVIRTVAHFAGRASLPMYGGQGGGQRVWGLAVDQDGSIYAALASSAELHRIDPSGKRRRISLGATEGWLATGVAAHEGRLYLLETKLEGGRNLGPRVRVRDTAGRWTSLGTAGSRK